MRWSWNDRRREKEDCWKEKHRLNCVVLRVRLWIEKEWESRKFWELWSNFDLKKEKLDVVSSDSKFDQFVLMFTIYFIDLFQSEMMLLSSKKMKNDYEIMKFEFSNWFDDDVEIDKANWLKNSVANFDDDDFSNWQNIRIETIQKIVFSNWLKNCVEIDEKIKKWIDVNRCDDDEKKSEKEKNYKNVFETLLSTIIIAVIIIIIIEKNVDFCEDFDILFICFVEFFSFVSFLKKEDWEKVSKSEFEESLKKKFVCVVYFFVEFVLSKDIHFDCEFCDSILIFFRFSASESVAFLIFSSTLKNLANENQLFVSFLSIKKKEVEIEKKIVFIFCSLICVFVNSSTENLLVFVFSVSKSIEWLFVVLNSRKSEIVQTKEIKFLDEKIVIKNDVSNFCEMNNSSSSSLNEFCVEIIKIEEKKEKFFFLFQVFCDRRFVWLSSKLLKRKL
jgi:hypothetical protein